ncbi:MAG: DNA repair protein RecO [Sutterella wadsworthensis]
MLVRAEWQGTMVPLTGEALLSGFYVNELILKLTVREERHPGLFEAYVKAIHALALDERDAMQPALREFEMAVLKAAGWAPAFSDDGRSPWYCVRDGALGGARRRRRAASRACAPGRGTSCAKCFRESR